MANEVSVRLIERLWSNWGSDVEGWGSRQDEIDLYTVRPTSLLFRSGSVLTRCLSIQINVPLVEHFLESPRYFFTRIWRNNCASTLPLVA